MPPYFVSISVGEFQLRQGKPRFPLIYRAHRDPQHLGQLLLGQSPLLAESTDILCQLDSNMTAPLSFIAFFITDDCPNENTPLIPSGQLFIILSVLFFSNTDVPISFALMTFNPRLKVFA